jgi:hypothetical protein
MISRDDLQLLQFADDPHEALNKLQQGITAEIAAGAPSFAKSVTTRRRRIQSRPHA